MKEEYNAKQQILMLSRIPLFDENKLLFKKIFMCIYTNENDLCVYNFGNAVFVSNGNLYFTHVLHKKIKKLSIKIK